MTCRHLFSGAAAPGAHIGKPDMMSGTQGKKAAGNSKGWVSYLAEPSPAPPEISIGITSMSTIVDKVPYSETECIARQTNALATEPEPSSSIESRHTHDNGGGGDTSGGGDGGGGGGGGGPSLCGIAAMEKVFHFLEGPMHVLRASTACRRWHELACAGSVWRVKVEREGILDKAAAFKLEVPPLLLKGASLEHEAAAILAFYARVFALKVVRVRSRAA